MLWYMREGGITWREVVITWLAVVIQRDVRLEQRAGWALGHDHHEGVAAAGCAALSAYAVAMQCPVLTWHMLLRGAWYGDGSMLLPGTQLLYATPVSSPVFQ
eukprot:3191240-Rhodomonas_salina.1